MDTDAPEPSLNTTTITEDGPTPIEGESGEDLLLSVKSHEALGLQKNLSLLSRLSAFDTLLNNLYEKSCPSSEDYANRKDLVRIFNEVAKEIYGNNDGCPVVEDFGSFSMDMFSARSDLDLSINFKDKLFEADRMEKIKTLRKFAKKFNTLKKRGHVTSVELILSARVPVLKVTDCGSGVECDFSVGNRDGVSKSHFVLMISAIDERFKKLSMMIKAWAKSNEINSSKDGTLNSISLILLVAFHLQTRDIPILPPFSAIFKDGTDQVDANLVSSFLNYGKRNTESLAELFVSLLVKLQSVEKFWPRGLCASTFEGSWIFKNWTATGCIRIEDFSDRSQNTARAVKSKKFKKIYSCIRRSLEHIQNFTEGKIDAWKLKKLLFGLVPPMGENELTLVSNSKLSKPISLNPAQKNAKSAAQVDPNGKRPNSIQKKKKHPPQKGPEGQRPGKQVKLTHCSSKASKVKHNPGSLKAPKVEHNPGTLKAPTPCKTDKVLQTVSMNPFPLFSPPIQSSGGVALIGAMNNAIATLQVAQSFGNQPAQSFGESGHQRASVGNVNAVSSSFPIRHYSLSNQPIEQYGGYRPHRTYDEASSHATFNFRAGQPLGFPNQHVQSSGGFPLDQGFQHSHHLHLQGYGRFIPESSHVDRLRNAPPNIPAGPPYSLSNTSSFQMSNPYSLRPTSVMPPYQANPRTDSYGNLVALNTPSLPLSDPYTLASRPGSVMHPNQRHHAAYGRNPADLVRPHDPHQSLPPFRSQFAANMHPHHH